MRRATWILWLMLALLPLRGWAAASMAMPVAAHDAGVSAAMADPAPQPASVMPCHQAGAQSDAGTNCQACDWCHAAMGVAPEALLIGKPPMADAPPVTAQRDTGRPAPGGLERPPRNLLA